MSELQDRARELLLAHISRFGDYHGQKENMTWGAATLYVAAVCLLLASDPFWAAAPWWKFVPFFLLLLGTAFCAFRFVSRQFYRRHNAARLVNGCSNVLTRWVLRPPEHADCELVPLGEHGFATLGGDSQLMPRVVIAEIQQPQQAPRQSVWDQWLHDDQNLTRLAMGGWTVAGLLRVLTSWQPIADLIAGWSR